MMPPRTVPGIEPKNPNSDVATPPRNPPTAEYVSRQMLPPSDGPFAVDAGGRFLGGCCRSIIIESRRGPAPVTWLRSCKEIVASSYVIVIAPFFGWTRSPTLRFAGHTRRARHPHRGPSQTTCLVSEAVALARPSAGADIRGRHSRRGASSHRRGPQAPRRVLGVPELQLPRYVE